MKRPIRVASWNIYIFGNRDYKGIARLIKENRIDIIGIQEAGIYNANPPINMVKKIAKRLGYHFIFFPAIKHQPDYEMGNAILSKFPIIEAKVYTLAPIGVKDDGTHDNEVRILVASKIKVGSRQLNFLCAHLSTSMYFQTNKIRMLQIKKIISIIEKLEGDIVLTGDFNSTPTTSEISLLSKKLERIGGDRPTWPTVKFDYKNWHERKLKYRVDNIFLSKNLKHKNFRILRSKISDHLPISADIELN